MIRQHQYQMSNAMQICLVWQPDSTNCISQMEKRKVQSIKVSSKFKIWLSLTLYFCIHSCIFCHFKKYLLNKQRTNYLWVYTAVSYDKVYVLSPCKYAQSGWTKTNDTAVNGCYLSWYSWYIWVIFVTATKLKIYSKSVYLFQMAVILVSPCLESVQSCVF